MKKILFATTALVATAGIASAEVALTGMAEIGIWDNGNDDTQFFTDLDVTFTMTGEADNGLTFGATIDLDEATDLPDFENPAVQGGENIFVSYGGATLTMGDTDGALDFIVPEMALAGGSLADDETIHGGFFHADGMSLDAAVNFFDAVDAIDFDLIEGSDASFAALVEALDAIGVDVNDIDSYEEAYEVVEASYAISQAIGLDGLGDGQIARFDYAYSDFVFTASAEQVANGADVAGLGETIWGVGVGYTGSFSGVDLVAGLGYQTLEDYADQTALAVTGSMANGFSAGLTYSVTDLDAVSDDVQHWGVGFGYEMNALAVGINYGEFKYDGEEQSGFGLAGSYDLGGGLSAKMGYGKTNPIVGDDVDTWSLGLGMSF
ncbi:porin [Salipiger pallidus]|uniref:Porin n=1 Tax=Salipiger pallidus TaxID=1775170 RepID=A0A8J2ZJN6_9RHOB|nr:porin [Salipiger pallidus]GGG71152.1 porin [Salipiger pallidus]